MIFRASAILAGAPRFGQDFLRRLSLATLNQHCTTLGEKSDKRDLDEAARAQRLDRMRNQGQAERGTGCIR